MTLGKSTGLKSSKTQILVSVFLKWWNFLSVWFFLVVFFVFFFPSKSWEDDLAHLQKKRRVKKRRFREKTNLMYLYLPFKLKSKKKHLIKMKNCKLPHHVKSPYLKVRKQNTLQLTHCKVRNLLTRPQKQLAHPQSRHQAPVLSGPDPVMFTRLKSPWNKVIHTSQWEISLGGRLALFISNYPACCIMKRTLLQQAIRLKRSCTGD